MDPRQLEERIARAKEAARLASIAAAARSGPPPPRPPPPFGSAPPSARPPPPPTAFGTGHAAPLSPPPFASQAVPEDVRRRIEHLAEFVRRNGPAFEETVKQRERDNPSFAFLRPGAPFHDVYEWHKRQPPNAFHPPGGPPSVVPRGPIAHALVPAVPSTPAVPFGADPMSSLAVGAMANVCRLAKASGLPPYAPIPADIVANVATLPPVEPGRLEIRLADFYRTVCSD